MKSTIKNLVLAILVAGLLLSSPAVAQTGGDYELRWGTIDSSGSTSTGGSYSLTGTIGQPDAD